MNDYYWRLKREVNSFLWSVHLAVSVAAPTQYFIVKIRNSTVMDWVIHVCISIVSSTVHYSCFDTVSVLVVAHVPAGTTVLLVATANRVRTKWATSPSLR